MEFFPIPVVGQIKDGGCRRTHCFEECLQRVEGVWIRRSDVMRRLFASDKRILNVQFGMMTKSNQQVSRQTWRGYVISCVTVSAAHSPCVCIATVSGSCGMTQTSLVSQLISPATHQNRPSFIMLFSCGLGCVNGVSTKMPRSKGLLQLLPAFSVLLG